MYQQGFQGSPAQLPPQYQSPYSQQYYQNQVLNQTVPYGATVVGGQVSQPIMRNPANIGIGNNTTYLPPDGNSSFQDETLIQIIEKQCLSSRINLSEMYINDEGAIKLSSVLQRYQNINYIELKGNNISSEGFRPIFQALQSNFAIKVLGLQWNRLGGNDVSGLEALYTLLANNRSITHLDLRNNRIGNTGAHILANIIRSNTTLQSLDLRWNEIGNNEAKAILAAAQENFSLISLELAGNSISESILSQVQHLTSINRDGNQRNVRRVQHPGLPEQNTLKSDHEFRSRQLNASQNSQYFDRVNDYHQQSHPQFVQNNLPYEQQQIIQHLEAQVEEERIRQEQLKQTINKSVEEKKSNLDNNNDRIVSLEEQLAEAQNTKGLLSNDMRNINEDLLEFQGRKKKKLEGIVEKNTQIENRVRDNDQKQQEEITGHKDKYVIDIKVSEQEWEDKVEGLKQDLLNIRTAIDDGRIEIHKLQDDMLVSDLNTKERAKEIVEKTRKESRREYQQKMDFLQNKLQKLQEQRLKSQRIMTSYTADRLNSQREFAVQYKEIEQEKVKRQLDIEDIKLRNKDFEIQQTKLKNDIKNKDITMDLLEEERQHVQKHFERNEKEVKEIQEDMDRDHDKEIKRVRDLMDIQSKRVKELEQHLKDSEQDNAKLRKDYARLSELLQGKLSTTIQNSFMDRNLI